ncbi:MAG: hypothetical protein J7K15_06735 [Deltaproteobacteria bacterium]|nr:hypothetical protein [Deltaproteobacteria bacterium]
MRLLEKFIELRGLKTKPGIDYFVKIKAAQRYDHTCHPTIGGVLSDGNRHKELCIKARKKTVAYFDIEKIAKQYAESYREALG